MNQKVSNAAPIANADSYATPTRTALIIDEAHGLLANDTDAEGDPLSVTGARLVSGDGTLVWNADGSFSFVPSDGSTGDAVIEYTTTDHQFRPFSAESAVQRVGTEFRVDTPTGFGPDYPGNSSSTADGGYVLTWSQNYKVSDGSIQKGIFAQRLNGAGEKLGNEILVKQDGWTSILLPKVAALSGGGFVVTWQGDVGGDGSGIAAQIYDAKGDKTGGEFRVNSVTYLEQNEPVVTGLSNGNFVVTWTDNSRFWEQKNNYRFIKAQIFDPAGNKIGEEFRVNQDLTFERLYPRITSLKGGGFVVTYTGEGHFGDPTGGWHFGTWARVYSPTDVPMGDEILFNSDKNVVQSELCVTGLSNGGFVVTKYYQRTGYIDAQIFDAAGHMLGGEFAINNQSIGWQMQPVVAGLSNGGFVVVWADAAHLLGDPDNWGIQAQVFDDLGNKVGAPFLVNTQTWANQQLASVVNLPDGGFAVSWWSEVDSGSIRSQIFHVGQDSVGHATVHVTDVPAGKTYTGTSADDFLNGGNGNDILDGKAGADTMAGGPGNDTYYVDNAGDTVIENAREGVDTVHSSLASYTLGANVENLVLDGNGNSNGTGNALANTITGNGGANTLDGKGGGDTLIGGDGDDTYIVRTSSDIVDESGTNGNDTVRTALSFSLQQSEHVRGDIERLVLNGTAAIDGTGNGLDNRITGNDGNNRLYGLDGNDRLSGGSGDDWLSGGAGRDVLTGGTGADHFVFDTAPDAASNIDLISDFNHAEGDKIELDRTIFSAFGDHVDATDATGFIDSSSSAKKGAHLYYIKSSGTLAYDADGSGPGAKIIFAHVTPNTELSLSDFHIF